MVNQLLSLILLLFSSAIWAQNAEDAIAIDEANVPDKVKAAVNRDFGKDLKIDWASTKLNFEQYGWEQIRDVSTEDINYYTIHTKLAKGSEIDAVYTPDGKLIRSREKLEDFEPPKNILSALEKSPYKDWKIDKDVHVIKDHKGKVQDHYVFLVQKGNERKNVYFDQSGKMLTNKKR
jgi:hypothetical protein